MLDNGTFKIVPKHAQRKFCFFSKLFITPKLENPIIIMVNHCVVNGNQKPTYKIPKPNSKNG